MVFRKAKLDKSLPLKPERLPIFGADGIDEDGHYDETKDRTFLKRLRKEYPKAYKEFIEAVGVEDEENS